MKLSPEDIELLENNGWTVVCESPFEIQHEDGSFASGQATGYALPGILEDLRAAEQLTCKTSAYEKLINVVERLNETFKTAMDVNNESAWKLAYNIVFSESGNKTVSQCFDLLNIDRLSYYDPDSSYEDDVTAYMAALNDRMPLIEKFESSFQDVPYSI